eukprot:7648591-Pyramimonas_sp.AAC.1
MEDNQAGVKVCKSGGSQMFMHLPQTHRADATAVAEQYARGIIGLPYCPTQDQAADVGANRFARRPSRAQ